MLAKGMKVRCYRNLRLAEGGFSIQVKGKVEGYSQHIILKDVEFTGAHAPAQYRIQHEGENKSVHAYAVGILMSTDEIPSHFFDGLIEVTYRPRERAGFFIISNGVEVTEADAVILSNNKLFAKNPR